MAKQNDWMHGQLRLNKSPLEKYSLNGTFNCTFKSLYNLHFDESYFLPDSILTVSWGVNSFHDWWIQRTLLCIYPCDF